MLARAGTVCAARPGGDDYQNVFVNPNNTKIIALASDQGVIISQNAGETWTQWFQPGDGAGVPRDCGQCVAISRLRRPAGQWQRVRLQAAATTAASPFMTGILPASRSTGMPHPIRSTLTSSMEAR